MLPPGATVVDLLSSDDDEDANVGLGGNVTGRPCKRPSPDENDDDCCIIEKPPPPALRTPVMPEPSSSTANDEVQCTGRSGVIALSDFPHARNNCAAYKWAEAPEKHCPQCFCYVCDTPVAECRRWSSHCHATNDAPHWQALRKRRAAERLRLPAACSTPHQPAPAATSSSSSSSSSSSAPVPAPAPAPAPAGRSCEWLVGTLTQVFPLEAPAPRGLAPSVTLKPYQKQSLAFMLELERTTDPRFVGSLPRPAASAASGGAPGPTVSERRGGWLCDEVGMGKTLVSIALILANPEPRADHSPGLSRATVVALPPTLIGQWQDELRRFAPGLKVVTFHSMDYGAGARATPHL